MIGAPLSSAVEANQCLKPCIVIPLIPTRWNARWTPSLIGSGFCHSVMPCTRSSNHGGHQMSASSTLGTTTLVSVGTPVSRSVCTCRSMRRCRPVMLSRVIAAASPRRTPVYIASNPRISYFVVIRANRKSCSDGRS